MRLHVIRARAGRRLRPCTIESRRDLPIAPNFLERGSAASALHRIRPAGTVDLPTAEGGSARLPASIRQRAGSSAGPCAITCAPSIRMAAHMTAPCMPRCPGHAIHGVVRWRRTRARARPPYRGCGGRDPHHGIGAPAPQTPMARGSVSSVPAQGLKWRRMAMALSDKSTDLRSMAATVIGAAKAQRHSKPYAGIKIAMKFT